MSGLPISTEKRVYDNILGAIGMTPLVRLGRAASSVSVPIYAKLENLNPGGSVKDRVGLYIIEQAEKRGELKPGGTIVEATSGNTGVGLAIAATLKGYKTIFVMPDKMSNEKIMLLRAYGAKVVITPTAVAPEDPRSYYEVAKQLMRETPNSILANQYHNPDNPKTHELFTGPEIWEQTDGKVTDVVIGMGTGGTISGVGRYLKSKNPEIKIVGIDIEGCHNFIVLFEEVFVYQQGAPHITYSDDSDAPLPVDAQYVFYVEPEFLDIVSHPSYAELTKICKILSYLCCVDSAHCCKERAGGNLLIP